MEKFKDFIKSGDAEYVKHFIGKNPDEMYEKQIEYIKHFIGKNPDEFADGVTKTKRRSVTESNRPSFTRQGQHRTYEAVNKLHDELLEHQEKTEHTDDEHTAIRRYTTSSAETFNRPHFRNARDKTTSETAPNFSHPNEYDEHLSSAIRRSTTHRSMHVYSGMRSIEDHPDSEDGHKHVHLPAYTSTSLSHEIAGDFGSQKKSDGKPSRHTYFATHMLFKALNKKAPGKVKEGEKYDPKNPDHKEVHDSKTETLAGDTSGTKPGKMDRQQAHYRTHGGSFEGYRHISRIHVPRGSHGLYTGNQDDRKNKRGTNLTTHDEHELILHHGAKVRFKSEPTVDHESKTVMWHGQLVHDGVKQVRK